MDATIWTTVGRHLDRTRDEGRETDPSAITDKQNVAIEGAVAKKRRIQARVVELLRREEAIPTDSGLSIEVPTIPKLPIRGMEGTDGLNSLWRSAAKDEAFELLASIAPGHLGLLETTLPDAAHAAQRAENDRAAAKKRGGSGGRKAKKAGTAEHAAQHLPIGEVDEDSACIDPETLIDDRPNPEEKAEAQEVAEHAIRIAIDRWGPSGQRMLEALTAGKTDKEAAEAAGISAPAMTKRLKTLQKMLDC
jgi:hypothetical protein